MKHIVVCINFKKTLIALASTLDSTNVKEKLGMYLSVHILVLLYMIIPLMTSATWMPFWLEEKLRSFC